VGRLGCGLVAMAVCVLSSGCIKDKVLVLVNKDGSGRIVVTRVFPRETAETMLGQVRAMMKQMESRGMPQNTLAVNADPFFNEKAIKREAARFGSSVRLVKARPIHADGARGYVALYQFTDINDVFIDLKNRQQQLSMSMYGGMRMGEDDDDPFAGRDTERSPQCYEFRFTPGATAKLRVVVPDFGGGRDGGAAEPPDEQPESSDDDDAAEADTVEGMQMMGDPMMGAGMARLFMGADSQGEMARRMLRGMALNVSVEVVGQPVKSTASHPESGRKSRFTLLNLDMDRMLASPEGEKLMKGPGMNRFGGMFGGEDEALGSLMKLSGATVETNREVTVEFN
jgi:hypothetical protein